MPPHEEDSDEEKEHLIHEPIHITNAARRSLRPHLIHLAIEIFLLFYIYFQFRPISVSSGNSTPNSSFLTSNIKSGSTSQKEPEYNIQRFKGSLYFQSPYKGPPTNTVEEAWSALWKSELSSPTMRNKGHTR